MVEPRMGGQRRHLGVGQHPHGRVGGLDLGALERLVVDEDEAVQPQVQRRGDGGHRLALGTPADLGVQEIVGQAVAAQRGQPLVRVVLAGDGLQHAARVQRPDRRHRLGPRRDAGGAVLGQGPGPQGLVQVPDQHLGQGRRRRGLSRRLGEGHEVDQAEGDVGALGIGRRFDLHAVGPVQPDGPGDLRGRTLSRRRSGPKRKWVW